MVRTAKTKRARIPVEQNGNGEATSPVIRSPLYVKPEATGPRKIAIIGKAPSSMSMAPYADQSWEIWSINDTLYRKQIPRANRQFELHNIELTKQPGYDDYYPWLTTCELPVFVNSDCPEIKNQVIYPRSAIASEFSIFTYPEGNLLEKSCGYFTNSISYLIALAIYELKGVEKDSVIGLWGVDMAQHGRHLKSEYASQRPSCELYVGIAMGRGIRVIVPEECDLLKCKTWYGFDTYNNQAKKAAVRKVELERRIAQAKSIAEDKGREAIFLEGALEDMFYHDQWIGE